MSRRYAAEYAAYCYQAFGRTKGFTIMSSDSAYQVWLYFYKATNNPTALKEHKELTDGQ